MENKHVAIHVDGNPGDFAKLNTRRKTRPILYFFIPRYRRSSTDISTTARQQCHDQNKTRHYENGPQSSSHIDLQSRNTTKRQTMPACLTAGIQ